MLTDDETDEVMKEKKVREQVKIITVIYFIAGNCGQSLKKMFNKINICLILLCLVNSMCCYFRHLTELKKETMN